VAAERLQRLLVSICHGSWRVDALRMQHVGLRSDHYSWKQEHACMEPMTARSCRTAQVAVHA
jgi:hypothetical protein